MPLRTSFLKCKVSMSIKMWALWNCQLYRIYNHIGCICLTVPNVYPKDSCPCLKKGPKRERCGIGHFMKFIITLIVYVWLFLHSLYGINNHISCICLTFLHCVFSNVSPKDSCPCLRKGAKCERCGIGHCPEEEPGNVRLSGMEETRVGCEAAGFVFL